MSYENEHSEFLFSLRTGVVRKTRAKKGVKCPRCDGRGTESCFECYSSGHVWRPCDSCKTGKSVPCPKCNNKPDPCRLCHGKSKVDLPSEPKGHPADAWTIRELRALSVNGSFR